MISMMKRATDFLLNASDTLYHKKTMFTKNENR